MKLQDINERAKQIDKANPLTIEETLKINLIEYKQSLFNQAKKELQSEQMGEINLDKIIRDNLK